MQGPDVCAKAVRVLFWEENGTNEEDPPIRQMKMEIKQWEKSEESFGPNAIFQKITEAHLRSRRILLEKGTFLWDIHYVL